MSDSGNGVPLITPSKSSLGYKSEKEGTRLVRRQSY